MSRVIRSLLRPIQWVFSAGLIVEAGYPSGLQILASTTCLVGLVSGLPMMTANPSVLSPPFSALGETAEETRIGPSRCRVRERARKWLGTLQDDRRAHAAADAEGGKAEREVALDHLVEQGNNDAVAGCADRMAKGNCAAVDV